MLLNLDDEKAILDTQGGDAVLKSVDALPLQLKQAFDGAQKTPFPETYKNARNIVVCGMGGSRFPSLILKDLFKDKLTIPYLVNDDYILPAFVDKNTLVILSSYSGTTEEVLTCGKLAREKGALLSGICAGGDVASFLKSFNAPVYIFDPVYNPSAQPRIGFGYTVGGHLGFLCQLGYITESADAINKALAALSSLLETNKINVPVNNNLAKQLAQKLYQKYPYYIVSEFLTGVGNAIANQTNETAKAISSFRIIPELNHHLMEGLKFPDKLHDIGLFLFFYSKLYTPPIQKRFQITKEVVEQNKLETIWVELKGKNKIEQVFEMMGLASYVTMYLSALYGQNPSTIPYVDYFKNKLKGMK